MSNRRRLRRPRFAPCPDCNSELTWLPNGLPFLAHDETCPNWRARTAAIREQVGDDALVVLLREVRR